MRRRSSTSATEAANRLAVAHATPRSQSSARHHRRISRGTAGFGRTSRSSPPRSWIRPSWTATRPSSSLPVSTSSRYGSKLDPRVRSGVHSVLQTKLKYLYLNYGKIQEQKRYPRTNICWLYVYWSRRRLFNRAAIGWRRYRNGYRLFNDGCLSYNYSPNTSLILLQSN